MIEYSVTTLGIVDLPEGFVMHKLDSGHWIWEHPESDTSSVIHWDRWATYRGTVDYAAKLHNEEKIQ